MLSRSRWLWLHPQIVQGVQLQNPCFLEMRIWPGTLMPEISLHFPQVYDISVWRSVTQYWRCGRTQIQFLRLAIACFSSVMEVGSRFVTASMTESSKLLRNVTVLDSSGMPCKKNSMRLTHREKLITLVKVGWRGTSGHSITTIRPKNRQQLFMQIVGCRFFALPPM